MAKGEKMKKKKRGWKNTTEGQALQLNMGAKSSGDHPPQDNYKHRSDEKRNWAAPVPTGAGFLSPIGAIRGYSGRRGGGSPNYIPSPRQYSWSVGPEILMG